MLVTKLFGSCNDIPTLWLRRHNRRRSTYRKLYENLGTNRSHSITKWKAFKAVYQRNAKDATSPLSTDPASPLTRHPWPLCSYPGTRTLRHSDRVTRRQWMATRRISRRHYRRRSIIPVPARSSFRRGRVWPLASPESFQRSGVDFPIDWDKVDRCNTVSSVSPTFRLRSSASVRCRGRGATMGTLIMWRRRGSRDGARDGQNVTGYRNQSL